jgi:curved DNA-binding protein CbpA
MMAADGPPGPARDLYQLLGVARDASREEIALAWRRRARDEHPDARQDDDGAPARFRALAEAWQVLGDPARRAAYDRGLDPGQHPGRVRITVRRSPAAPGSAAPGSAAPGSAASGPAAPGSAASGPAAPRPGVAGSTAPLTGPAGPPLVAGPVWVEGGFRPLPRADAWDEEELRLALLAELVRRYHRRGRPW